MSGDRQWKRVIKSKEEQERIMIACYASPEGKSSGLARIQNFKVGFDNILRGLMYINRIRAGEGGGGGGGGDHPCDRPNTSGEGEGRPN